MSRQKWDDEETTYYLADHLKSTNSQSQLVEDPKSRRVDLAEAVPGVVYVK